jgi:hypothetical protein
MPAPGAHQSFLNPLAKSSPWSYFAVSTADVARNGRTEERKEASHSGSRIWQAQPGPNLEETTTANEY